MRDDTKTERERPDVALRDLRLAQLFPLWMLSALIAWKALSPLTVDMLGIDTHAYWLTGNHGNLYGVAPGKIDAFLYSPAFATLISPLTELAYHPFLAVWSGMEIASFAWLLAPLGWRWAVPLLLLLTPVMTQGQIVGFLCISAVVGMTYPAGWVFPLLTKVSSGLGLIWFAARMDWGAVVKVLVATLMVSSISFIITPKYWVDWLQFLLRSGADSGGFLYVRVITAALITAVAARKDKAWLIAPAMWLASPVFVGVVGYSYLTAIPRLLQLQGVPANRLAASQPTPWEPSSVATATDL
jgi:hypothetical protein